MDAAKTLQKIHWIQLDVLQGGNQAVGVIFPKPKPKDIREINNFLNGCGISGPSKYGNEWAWVNIKNLDAALKKGFIQKITPLSEVIAEATWTQERPDGTRAAYFAHRKDAIRCVEAFKQMQFVAYDDLGFLQHTTDRMKERKGSYDEALPNLFSTSVPEVKLACWFPEAKWEEFGPKEIPSIQQIRELFQNTKWVPNNLAQLRQDGTIIQNFSLIGPSRGVSYTAEFKKSVDVAKIAWALELTTGVKVSAGEKSIAIEAEKIPQLKGIVPDALQPKDPVQRTFKFD